MGGLAATARLKGLRGEFFCGQAITKFYQLFTKSIQSPVIHLVSEGVQEEEHYMHNSTFKVCMKNPKLLEKAWARSKDIIT